MKVNTIIDNDMPKLNACIPYEIFKKLFTYSLNLKRLSFILPFGAHQSFFDKVFVIYLTF